MFFDVTRGFDAKLNDLTHQPRIWFSVIIPSMISISICVGCSRNKVKQLELGTNGRRTSVLMNS